MKRLGLLAALLVAGSALAAGARFVLSGEPGPPGAGLDPAVWCSREAVDAKLPDSDQFVLVSDADEVYVRRDEAPPWEELVATDAWQPPEQWAPRAWLDEHYWHAAALPGLEGKLSRAQADALYVRRDELPPPGALLEWDELPVLDDYVTPDDFAAFYVTWDDLAGLPTLDELDAVLLQPDEAPSGALAQSIEQTVSAWLDAPTCPPDMRLVGDTCVDRYEASLWTAPCDEEGAQPVEASPAAVDARVAVDGTPLEPAYACSVAGVSPARWVTWFQAMQLCAASGKRLCSVAEWGAAAAGTPAAACGEAGELVEAGARTACVSDAGVFDAAGNVREWLTQWTAGGHSVAVSTALGSGLPDVSWMKGGWNVDDVVRGVDGAAAGTAGLPAAITAGGGAPGGAPPAARSFEAVLAPLSRDGWTGFRCCRRLR